MTQRDQGSYKLFWYISIQTSTKRLREEKEKKKIQNSTSVNKLVYFTTGLLMHFTVFPKELIKLTIKSIKNIISYSTD